MQCLISLESEELKTQAKMELIATTNELMPGGAPKYLEVVRYPMIKQLTEQYGRKTMTKVLYLMVKDLCSSLNIAHNMNEDQVIEAAAMLLEECDNFRLEDYQMMFTMAKRGKLVEFKHQLDISVIGNMMDEYYKRRQAAAQQHYEQAKAEDKQRFEQLRAPVVDKTEGEYTFSDIVDKFTAWQKEELEAEKKQQEAQAGIVAQRQQQTAEKLRKIGVPETLIQQYWKDEADKDKRD